MNARTGDKTRPPLYDVIYAAVRLVPRGKVATYGQIAAVIGKPRAPRAVGRALRELPDSLTEKVPWQRVINAAGKCSERGGFWADRQRERLLAEGVHVDGNGKVDMRHAAWKGPPPAQTARIRRELAAAEKGTRKPAGRSLWVASPKRAK